MLQIKRIYDEPATTDGMRVLVDRLWPRGMTKQRAAADVWLKDVAPSPELRAWFGHRPERFAEFAARYTEELQANPAVDELRRLVAQSPRCTLLYAAKDARINHAVVLREFLVQ